jgi:hypothetical protein
MHLNPRVKFYPSDVSSILRPPSTTEMAIMSDFEDHVRCCQRCARWGSCYSFRRLARSLISRLQMGADGLVYSTLGSRWIRERVEVPRDLETVFVYLRLYADWLRLPRIEDYK